MHAKIIKPKNLSLDLLSDFREALSFTDFVRELKSFPEPPEWRPRMQKTSPPPPPQPGEGPLPGMGGKPASDPPTPRRVRRWHARRGFAAPPDLPKSGAV